MRKFLLVLFLLPLGGMAYYSLPLTSVAVLTITLIDAVSQPYDIAQQLLNPALRDAGVQSASQDNSLHNSLLACIHPTSAIMENHSKGNPEMVCRP